MREHERPAVSETKFIADERWDAPPVQPHVIEIVARIEGRVTHKLENAAVHIPCARTRNHIGVTGRPVPNLGWHHSGTRLHFLDAIDVEIGKRRAAHFWIGGISAINIENRGGSTLSVDRK